MHSLDCVGRILVLRRGRGNAMSKNTFITGGTGFVGAHVVQKAIQRGDLVTALTRSA